jgi:hypothetical protein
MSYNLKKMKVKTFSKSQCSGFIMQLVVGNLGRQLLSAEVVSRYG